MNGPEHYAEAERLLSYADQLQTDASEAAALHVSAIAARAQVHATLAHTAALAAHVPPDGASGYSAWRAVTKPEPDNPWEG